MLSARGDAVTCGHLVNGVYRLVAEMYDGTKREVTIYSFDADADIAHIRVVGSTLPYLGAVSYTHLARLQQLMQRQPSGDAFIAAFDKIQSAVREQFYRASARCV